MLELHGITKYYDTIRAVQDVTLRIRNNEVFGLVGPNGSGKSTLLKIMLGILRPSSGEVLVNGNRITGRDWKAFKRSTGYMPERVSFYDNLTGRETLRLFSRIKGGDLQTMGDVLRRILPDDVLDRKVGEYSKGMRQRLNLSQAILNDPDLLVLDEPTSGLDPVGTRNFYEILDEVKSRKNLTVVLSSHILAEIEDKTDRVAVMKNGHLKALGGLEDLYRGMKLPMKIFITTHGKDGTLERVLVREGAHDLGYHNGYLFASVPRENKMKIISALMDEKERFSDISFREPSLEEVFFGVH